MKKLEKSEFGKGLTVCLAKFLEHFGYEKLTRIYFIETYKNKPEVEQKAMVSDNPPDNLNYGVLNGYLKFFVEDIVPIHKGNIDDALSHEIETWANGASDHLYEIEVPKGEDWDNIRKMVEELKDKGLKMGHSLTKDTIWKVKDINELKELTLKILLEVDKKIGLQPDLGEY